MVIGPSDTDFNPVTQLCNTTKKHIRSITTDLRYLKDGVWWVHNSKLAVLLALAKATGNHTTLDYSQVEGGLKATLDSVLKPKKRVLIPLPKSSPYHTLHLQESAPRELVEAAFKVLAKKLHPDVTKDDGEPFRRMKEAYDLITGQKR